jgi:hypothetical protein
MQAGLAYIRGCGVSMNVVYVLNVVVRSKSARSQFTSFLLDATLHRVEMPDSSGGRAGARRCRGAAAATAPAADARRPR